MNVLREHCCSAPVLRQVSKLARMVDHVSTFFLFHTLGFSCFETAVNAGCPITVNLLKVYRDAAGLHYSTISLLRET